MTFTDDQIERAENLCVYLSDQGTYMDYFEFGRVIGISPRVVGRMLEQIVTRAKLLGNVSEITEHVTMD